MGKPVIEINVDPDQVDDRVDEALMYYWDYHFDGVDLTYYKHQITANDISNRFILLPQNVIGAIDIFPMNDPSVRVDDLFSIRYQIALNDLYTLTSVSLVPYYMVLEHLNLVNEIVVGKQPIRYNRNQNKAHLDLDWNSMQIGQFLLVRAYMVIDPNLFTKVWQERWLQNYATALIGEQWARNLLKYVNLQLVSGTQYNAAQLYQIHHDERVKLEERMSQDIQLPILDSAGDVTF